MDFEQPSSGDASPDISDEQRRAASARQRVVDPIHDTIAVDDESADVVANRHILEGPIANAANDFESTVAYHIHDLNQRHGHHLILTICIITACIIIGITYLIIYQQP